MKKLKAGQIVSISIVKAEGGYATTFKLGEVTVLAMMSGRGLLQMADYIINHTEDDAPAESKT